MRVDKFHIDILTAHSSRTRTGSTSSSPATCSATSSATSAGLHGHDRHRADGEHQPEARPSRAFRARTRLGARHRRTQHRQPDRPDLVRRDDARAPRPPRSRRGDAGSHRTRARARHGAHPGPGRQRHDDDPRDRHRRRDQLVTLAAVDLERHPREERVGEGEQARPRRCPRRRRCGRPGCVPSSP